MSGVQGVCSDGYVIGGDGESIMVSLHRGGWPETVDWDVFCEDTFGEHFFAASALTPSCGIVYDETMPCSADECTVLSKGVKITTGYRLCL